jgi:hypothetical protein
VLGEDILNWFNGVEGVRPKKAAIGLSIVKRVLELHGFVFGAEVRDGMRGDGGGAVATVGANVFWFRMPVIR